MDESLNETLQYPFSKQCLQILKADAEALIMSGQASLLFSLGCSQVTQLNIYVGMLQPQVGFQVTQPGQSWTHFTSWEEREWLSLKTSIIGKESFLKGSNKIFYEDLKFCRVYDEGMSGGECIPSCHVMKQTTRGHTLLMIFIIYCHNFSSTLQTLWQQKCTEIT